MAITRFAGDRFTGLSSDTKPTTVVDGALFIETNTGQVYQRVSGEWVKTRIQVKSVTQENLDAEKATAIVGELFFTTDTHKLYVYTGTRMEKIGPAVTAPLLATQTVENTTTETTIYEAGIPANTLEAGDVIKVIISGKVSTAASSDFFNFRLRLGGTSILITDIDPKNVTDAPFRMEVDITIRTTGATGTYAADLMGWYNGDAVNPTPVTGTIDTTVAEDLEVQVTWNEAKAGNVLEVLQGWIEFNG